MKAVLRFRLPEEQLAMKWAWNGGKYYGTLCDLDNFLRNKVKHNPEGTPEGVTAAYQEIRDQLHEFLKDREISEDFT